MTYPHQSPQYGTPQHGGQQSVYRASVRPPLTSKEKRSALWAGAWGFNLLTLGFTFVIVPIIIGLFGAFFRFLVESIARSSDELTTGFLVMLGVFRSIDFGLVALVGAAVALVGLAIVAGALFLSRGILRSSGVNRPWAVTWSGAGIAIIASWILGWIPAVIAQIASSAIMIASGDGVTTLVGSGVVAIVFGIALTTVIGWLAWWWMTFAFRPATRDESPTATVL